MQLFQNIFEFASVIMYSILPIPYKAFVARSTQISLDETCMPVSVQVLICEYASTLRVRFNAKYQGHQQSFYFEVIGIEAIIQCSSQCPWTSGGSLLASCAIGGNIRLDYLHDKTWRMRQHRDDLGGDNWRCAASRILFTPREAFDREVV